jgi:ABC-type phosphate transport system permease subunit
MGLGPWAMGVFLVLLAVILIGVFAGVWLRDRHRSNDVSDDASRQRTGRRR